MPRAVRIKLSCPRLADYFREAFRPRAEWLVGIEVETMGLDAATGRPLAYDGPGATVRSLVEAYAGLRGGERILEGDKPIGIDGSWGGISLEPGGQFEWSARPVRTLDELSAALDGHLEALRAMERELGIRWLELGVQPDAPVEAMPWMPKARYGIMREIMARRGRLAHRMMTQTASIQCAFDYASDADWTRKFRAAALIAPIAVALFANSRRIDGRDSGWESYRQAIWRETDPDRCDLPDVVFDPGFGIDAWVEWVCDVPTLFLRRGQGLIASEGRPFRAMMERAGCDGVTMEDWELHLSSIFTEVRSYSYIEVRSADLQPFPLILAVPAFWSGLLYDDGALDEALALGRRFDDPASWRRGMDVAAREGLRGVVDGEPLAGLAARAVALATRSLDSAAGRDVLAHLARAKAL